MKKLVMVLVAAFAMVVAAPAAAQAQDSRPGGFGLGLGQATGVSGISGKIHTGDIALQGVVGNWWGGWGRRYHYDGPRRRNGLGLSFDILANMETFHDADVVQLAWNLGGGAAVGVHPDWDPRVRGQFVAGLEFIFPEVPLDLVIEYRPHLQLTPGWGFHLFGAGAHIRFYID